MYKACITFLIYVKIPMKSTVKELKMSYSVMYFFNLKKSNAYLHLNEVQNDKRQILNTVGSLSVFWVCCDRTGISLPLFRMSLCIFTIKVSTGEK